MSGLLPLTCAPHGVWVVVESHGHVVDAKFGVAGWRNRDGHVIVSKIDGWRPIDCTDAAASSQESEENRS